MDYKILIYAFVGLVVVFVGATLARMGFEKLEAWMKANPFKAAIAIAAVLAVVIAVWAGKNQGLIECWPMHKLQCFSQWRDSSSLHQQDAMYGAAVLRARSVSRLSRSARADF